MEELERAENADLSEQEPVLPDSGIEDDIRTTIEPETVGDAMDSNPIDVQAEPTENPVNNDAIPASAADDLEEKEAEKTEQAQPKQKKPKMKKLGLSAAIAVLAIAIIISSTSNSGLKQKLSDADSLNAELQQKLDEADTKIKDLEKEVTDLKGQIDELENGASAQLVGIKNAFEAQDWEKVISLAAALHKDYNGVAEDTEAQQLAADAQKKIDEANAAKAAEEAKGYETGITYDQLARTPDDFVGSKVKVYGKVVQVIEGDDTVQLRLAVNGDYDQILFLEYKSDLVKSRVLEDDYITIYGTSAGTITYKSTMGGNITIPAVWVAKIDQ